MITLTKKKIKNGLIFIWKAWDEFWFSGTGYLQIKFFRFFFCLNIFFCYLIRTLEVKRFYTQKGLLSVEASKEIYNYKYFYSIMHYLYQDYWVWFFYALLLISLLLVAVGWKTKIFSWIAFFTHISFFYRNSFVVYGIDLLTTYFLFYFAIASFDSFKHYPEKNSKNWILGTLSFRLCQIQVCLIYMFSGIHKLKGVGWWSGEAVWDTLINPQISIYNFEWLKHFYWIVILSTYFTVLWEIYFCALIWNKKMRLPVLIMGVCIHLGIGITTNIAFFSLGMISSYFLFLDTTHLKKIENYFKKYLPFLKIV